MIARAVSACALVVLGLAGGWWAAGRAVGKADGAGLAPAAEARSGPSSAPESLAGLVFGGPLAAEEAVITDGRVLASSVAVPEIGRLTYEILSVRSGAECHHRMVATVERDESGYALTLMEVDGRTVSPVVRLRWADGRLEVPDTVCLDADLAHVLGAACRALRQTIADLPAEAIVAGATTEDGRMYVGGTDGWMALVDVPTVVDGRYRPRADDRTEVRWRLTADGTIEELIWRAAIVGDDLTVIKRVQWRALPATSAGRSAGR